MRLPSNPGRDANVDTQTSAYVHRVADEVGHVRQDREENGIERRGFVLVKEQIVKVRLGDLGRVARVDRAVFAAFLPEILGGGVAEYYVLRPHAEHLQVRAEKRRRRIHVQHARNPDAPLGSLLRRGLG